MENKNEVKTDEVKETKNVNTNKDNKKPFKKSNNRRRRKKFTPRRNKYEERVIDISRVIKMTKGGRNLRFTATMAVGDEKGRVGIGSARSKGVPEAIQKAKEVAIKNMVTVPIIDNRTIPHEATGVVGGARVLLKPAKEGAGIVAGGAVRSVVELAGVKDITTKSLGSNTHSNVAKATLKALTSMTTKEEVARLRGINVEDL